MIYHLYFGLIMGGYYSVSTLLGSYMIHYAGASELDLGFLFMIQPVTIFARPFMCAQADRSQSHKQMLAFYSILTSLSYISFAIMPFLESDGQQLGNERLRFWLMVVFHSIGSLGFCGVRSLGDALAINFAKRFGTDYARYRKYGAISYGICGYLIGRINQKWLLPDFVPGLLMHCTCMLSLGLLVYAWPNEYFLMTSNQKGGCQVAVKMTPEELEAENEKLPSAGQTAAHVFKRLFCLGSSADEDSKQANLAVASQQQLEEHENKTNKLQAGLDQKIINTKDWSSSEEDNNQNLSIRQQLGIFKLLVKRDYRLVLYLLVIFYNGLVAYSGPNFVFTYLNETCRRKGTCNGAQLAGIVMISYCGVETIGYMIIDKLRGHLNRVLMLELTFLSVMIHYFFYGFLLDSLSPYWFLVESLHGIEYSIGLSTSVELGYYFAKEVELLLPELISKGIISERDDKERVRVSLMATLSGCYTFMYDGIGCIVGCLVFGLTTGLYSFRTTWLLIGSLSTIGFVVLFLSWLIGKCCHLRPKILETSYQSRAAAMAEASKTSSC